MDFLTIENVVTNYVGGFEQLTVDPSLGAHLFRETLSCMFTPSHMKSCNV